MIIGLILILLATLFLPLISKQVEHNLELFLFIVGILATLISKVLSKNLIIHIMENKFMYLIAIAVLCGGILFQLFSKQTMKTLENILKYMSLEIFVFIIIVFLGIISSILTAIIASLILVEIINILPLSRNGKINIVIISCFSIGLGATLTPIGEPLATIVISKLGANFWYLFDLLGVYIIPLILVLGLLGAWYARIDRKSADKHENIKETENISIEEESYKDIITRTIKVFAFVIALELLGSGFKPIIDNNIINLNSKYLYWINISSAVLDNATLASAEISVKMTKEQIKVILMGLLISGGMMITGNIPNIISANKLKIKSKEWISLGVPLGLIIMITFFFILFFL